MEKTIKRYFSRNGFEQSKEMAKELINKLERNILIKNSIAYYVGRDFVEFTKNKPLEDISEIIEKIYNDFILIDDGYYIDEILKKIDMLKYFIDNN